jgi:parallel beta-helix repeat protein
MNKSFYVSSINGNDRSSGIDQNSPFASLQKAADMAGAGDTVYVMPGNYTNADPNQNVLTIDKSGTAGAPITFKAFDLNNKPVIKVRNYVGIEVVGSYINLDGLIVEGNAKEFSNMTAEQVDALQKSQGRFTSPITSGTGIAIGGFYRNTSPHHVTISNSIVKDNPGGGISSVRADYVTIENNEVSGNAFYAPYDTSGISLYQNSNSDSNTGLKMIVRGNIVFGNKNLISDYNNYRDEDFNNPDPAKRPKITDGNGIIIDDAARTQVQGVDGGQSAQNLPAYQGKTLIENNKVFDNGGRGIHAFNSFNVDIRNNTLANNLLTPSILGQEVDAYSNNSAMAKGAGQAVMMSNNNIISHSAILDLIAATAKNIAGTIMSTPAAALAAVITPVITASVFPSVPLAQVAPVVTAPVAPSVSAVPSEKYTQVGTNGDDIITGSNSTGYNDLFGEDGDDIINSGTAAQYNYIIGGNGNDQINLNTTQELMDIIIYESGAGKDTVNNFIRGRNEMNDQVHFKGIQNVDVVSNGGNTELRIGDGITGNAGFGTGTLLVELKGTTGLNANDVGISLFGSNFDF